VPFSTVVLVDAANAHWAGILILICVFALLVSLAIVRAFRPRREPSEHLGLLADVEDASE
jgi:hypothetical protein